MSRKASYPSNGTQYTSSRYGPSAYGQGSYGQSSYGQNSYGQNKYGQGSYGQGSYGNVRYPSSYYETSAMYRKTSSYYDAQEQYTQHGPSSDIVPVRSYARPHVSTGPYDRHARTTSKRTVPAPSPPNRTVTSGLKDSKPSSSDTKAANAAAEVAKPLSGCEKISTATGGEKPPSAPTKTTVATDVHKPLSAPEKTSVVADGVDKPSVAPKKTSAGAVLEMPPSALKKTSVAVGAFEKPLSTSKKATVAADVVEKPPSTLKKTTAMATPSFSSAQHRLTAAMTPGFGRGYMTTPGQEYLLTPDSVVPAKNSSTKSGFYYHNSEIRLNESSTVEFKAGGGGNRGSMYYRDVFPQHVDKYTSGFLNSHKGGMLMIGVTDNGIVAGMHAPHHVQRSMEDVVRSRLKSFKPSVSPKHYHFSFKPVLSYRDYPIDGLFVAILEVYPLTASSDITTIFETRDGKAYLKYDGSVKELTVPKIVEHIRSSYDKVLRERLTNQR